MRARLHHQLALVQRTELGRSEARAQQAKEAGDDECAVEEQRPDQMVRKSVQLDVFAISP